MALSKSGNFYLSDASRHVIRKISPSGDETVLAGNDGFQGTMDGNRGAALFRGPGLIAVDAQDTLYAIDGTAIRRITPDGNVTTFAGLADETGTADGPGEDARFMRITGIVASGDGAVFVADGEVIRQISATGYVQTIAGKRRTQYEKFVPDSYDRRPVDLERVRFNLPLGLAADGANRLFVLDSDSIRLIELGGE